MSSIFFNGDDFMSGPKPALIDAAALESMQPDAPHILLKNALHIVEVSALQKGTARIYTACRWLIFDEAKMSPLSPPVVQEEESFTDDAAAAAEYANDLAARTAHDDRAFYE